MSINLLEKIQQNLNYPALKKIDPNTQDIVLDPTTPPENKLAQAAIPSLLTGLYKFLKTEEGVNKLLRQTDSGWVAVIFGNNKDELVRRVATYSSYLPETVENEMDKIAFEAVYLIKENTKPDNAVTSIQSLLASERNNILSYLPAILNIGELLDDTTLDDKTNKMEGPISTLMHKIENGFSNPD